MHSLIQPQTIWAPLTGSISAVRLRIDHNGTVTWDNNVQYGWALQSLTSAAITEVRDQDNNITTTAKDAVYTDIPSARGTIEMAAADYLAWPDGVSDESYVLPYTASKLGVVLISS